jgi:hypothetical protein
MSVLVSIAPLLLLVAALTLGRYPGERALARARLAPRLRRRTPSSTGGPAREPHALVRGGLLVASSLAGRAPPGAVA